MKIRRANDRGLTELPWLKSRHTFSFGEYFDPNYLGYRCLRVINDDWVAPGKGFGMHGHRDMEIITIVVEGELEHQDSLGHREVLRPGEVQVMSAGRGIRHSEYNASPTKPAHFLQIWIEPKVKGIEPLYEQKAFPSVDCADTWCRIAGSADKNDNAFLIRQDADVYLATLSRGKELSYPVEKGVACWLQIVEGQVRVGEAQISSGDAVSTEKEGRLSVVGLASQSQVILFALR